MRFPAILKEAAAVFGRVSVVQIASEVSAKERAEGRRNRATTGSARRIFSSGSRTQWRRSGNHAARLLRRELAASAERPYVRRDAPRRNLRLCATAAGKDC